MFDNALKTFLTAAALLPALAHAGTVAYSDASTWAASAGTTSTVTFEGGTDWVFRDYQYTEGGVTFESTDGIYSIYGVDYDAAYHSSGYLDVEGTAVGLTFASAVNAFGFEFGAFYDSPVTLTITLSDDSVFTVQAAAGQYGFFGIVSSVPITGLTFTTDYPYTTLDNVTLGSAVSSVPEPASPVLFGLGVAGLLVVRRRQRR